MLQIFYEADANLIRHLRVMNSESDLFAAICDSIDLSASHAGADRIRGRGGDLSRHLLSV